MIDLDLTAYEQVLKTRRLGNRTEIFDPVRGKWVALQPEELVRQLFLAYCIEETIWPRNLISVERKISLHGTERRYDIAMYHSDGEPRVLVECKAHTVRIDITALEQIAWYNVSLQVPYLIVTNGLHTFVCEVDHNGKSWKELDRIPCYNRDSDH